MQSSQKRNDVHLENFTPVQKVATAFRMIHLLASVMLGTMHAAVPVRTFLSTITIDVSASKFDIHTRTAILPAGGTAGIATKPDHRPDEAGCKKRAGDCRECFHLTAANHWPELARKRQYERKDN